MSNLRLNSIFPESQKEEYETTNEVIDFVLTFPNKKIVQNSFYVSGFAEFTTNGSASIPNVNVNAYYDPLLGAHSFFNYVSVKTDNQGVISINNNYPKFVKMKLNGKDTKRAYAQESEATMAGITYDKSTTTGLMLGSTDTSGLLPWCVKLMIPLNDMMGNPSFKKTGSIRVSLSLNDGKAILQGDSSILPAPKVKLSSLQAHYMTFDDDGEDTPVFLKVVNSAQHTVTSGNDNFYLNSSIPSYAVIGSFTPSNYLNNVNVGQYELTNPNISSLVWSFNDQTNKVITYNLRNDTEILLNAMYALDSNKAAYNFAQLEGQDYIGSDSYMIGVNIGQQIDFRKQKLGVNVQSAINSSRKNQLDLYFLGEVQI